MNTTIKAMTVKQFKTALKAAGIEFAEGTATVSIPYRARPFNWSAFRQAYGYSADERDNGIRKTTSREVPAVIIGDKTIPLKRLERKDRNGSRCTVLVQRDLAALLARLIAEKQGQS